MYWPEDNGLDEKHQGVWRSGGGGDKWEDMCGECSAAWVLDEGWEAVEVFYWAVWRGENLEE